MELIIDIVGPVLSVFIFSLIVYLFYLINVDN